MHRAGEKKDQNDKTVKVEIHKCSRMQEQYLFSSVYGIVTNIKHEVAGKDSVNKP